MKLRMERDKNRVETEGREGEWKALERETGREREKKRNRGN